MTKGYKTGGRQLGTPNKATLESRLVLSALIDSNLDKLTNWLDQVAGGIRKIDPATGEFTDEYVVRPNPAKAFDMIMSVVEYRIPKLARTELVATEVESDQSNENLIVFSELLRSIKARRQAEQYK
jgi:hypothetical protein